MCEMSPTFETSQVQSNATTVDLLAAFKVLVANMILDGRESIQKSQS